MLGLRKKKKGNDMSIWKKVAVAAAGVVVLSGVFIGGFAASEHTRKLSRDDDSTMAYIKTKCDEVGGCRIITEPVYQQMIAAIMSMRS